MKKVSLKLMIFIVLLIFTSCSITYPVNTKSTESLKKEIKSVSSTIKNVDVSFTRPQLTISVYFNYNTTPNEIETVLSKVKLFTSLKNMNEISHKVGWSGYIWEVNLFIFTYGNTTTPYVEYQASYYKTYDIDNSPNNIDGYKTWYPISQ